MMTIAFVCGHHPIAPYVDDQVPHQCQQVLDLRDDYGTVIAGIPQGEANHKCAGALNALEWYPFWRGSVELPVPCGHLAYIVQWSFAWPGSNPPTRRQRTRELHQAEKCHPRLIIKY